MSNAETIAAISTALAPGGIGIVRISGTQARAIAAKLFRPSNPTKDLEDLPGYCALYGKVLDDQEEIDEAIALNFRAPKSFTGEDVVELSCHGGPVVLSRVLQAALRAGAVPAGPGEFTKRAFLNGKIGLTQAESVMDLIGAQGEQAARAALAEKNGALERRISAIEEALLDAAAHLDAWADYPEDEIPFVDPTQLMLVIEKSIQDLRCLLDQFEAGRAMREGVRTVIVGRPNVGKSTLMNALAGCEKSIVTQFAGTTRDVVEDTVLLGGVPLLLADTAGMHETQDPVERIGVERAKQRIQAAQLVFAVFDSSQELSGEDRAIIDQIKSIPSIAVVNKSDLPNQIDIPYLTGRFSKVVSLSALHGEGISLLEQAVQVVLKTDHLDPSAGMLFTQRQKQAAGAALTNLEEARQSLQTGMTLDAVTVLLESAVSALLELTGQRASEAVVDRVFSKFCVGK